MKTIQRTIIFILIGVVLCLCMACGKSVPGNNAEKPGPGNENGNQSGENMETEIKSILLQTKFEYGFSIAYMSSKNWIDYNGAVDYTLSKWGINEEGSADTFNADTEYTEEDGFKVFASPNKSKIFKVNNDTGAFYMEVNASVDYGTRPREDGESWPHLLITQNYNLNEIPNLDKMQSLRMKINFDFLKFEDKMNGAANSNYHAAQFQWYVAIKNVNPDSPDYGDWFWLGLQFFDNRYIWCPKNLLVDGGKDTATGKAIYTLDMRDVMNRKVVEAGESYNVDYDILPDISKALAELKNFQEMDTLRRTELSDLQIFHTNIGWEMPGTYDAAVKVNSWDFNYTLNKSTQN